jgi:hypothetical protein
MERQRTGGMTAIAVLNIIFGGLDILNGLFLVLGAFALGIFALRPWGRSWSLAYGLLLMLSSAISFSAVPIIASIGTYDIGSLSAYGLARLIIFGALYVAFPAPYALLLYFVFYKPPRRPTFGKDRLPAILGGTQE